jgi:hypothetical protein
MLSFCSGSEEAVCCRRAEPPIQHQHTSLISFMRAWENIHLPLNIMLIIFHSYACDEPGGHMIVSMSYHVCYLCFDARVTKETLHRPEISASSLGLVSVHCI